MRSCVDHASSSAAAGSKGGLPRPLRAGACASTGSASSGATSGSLALARAGFDFSAATGFASAPLFLTGLSCSSFFLATVLVFLSRLARGGTIATRAPRRSHGLRTSPEEGYGPRPFVGGA